MDEITRKRLSSNGPSVNWSPRELLEYALDEINRGVENPNKVILLLIEERGLEKGLVITPYRSNIRYIEGVGYLEMAKAIQVDNWMHGKIG